MWFVGNTTIVGKSLPSGVNAGKPIPPGGYDLIWFDPRIQHMRIEHYASSSAKAQVTYVPIARCTSWEPA
ncbi:MAG: hypothetical protein AAB262_09170 [Elusimicrobiota bacterium]